MGIKNYYYDYVTSLQGDYKDMYDEMYLYITSTSKLGVGIENIMNEVVDLLLSAQADERPLHQVIGKDMPAFCDQLIESFSDSFIARFLNTFVCFRYFVGFYILIQVIDVITKYAEGVTHLWLQMTPIGCFVFPFGFAILSAIVYDFLVKLIIKFIGFKSKLIKPLEMIMILSLGIVIIGSIFFFSESIDQLIQLPRYVVLLGLCLLFALLQFYHQWRCKQAKTKAQDTTTSFDTTCFNANVDLIKKKYAKYLNSCQKKQIPAKAIQQWYQGYHTSMQIKERLSTVLIIFICIGAILLVALTSTLFDTFIFCIIFATVQIPLYLLLDKGRKARNKIHTLITANGIERLLETSDDASSIE